MWLKPLTAYCPRGGLSSTSIPASACGTAEASARTTGGHLTQSSHSRLTAGLSQAGREGPGMAVQASGIGSVSSS